MEKKNRSFRFIFKIYQLGVVGLVRGGGVKKGWGCSWGTLRIPFGKIGEPQGRLGKSPPRDPKKNPITWSLDFRFLVPNLGFLLVFFGGISPKVVL